MAVMVVMMVVMVVMVDLFIVHRHFPMIYSPILIEIELNS